VRNATIKLPIPFHHQTQTQCVQEVAPKGEPSNQVKSRLALARLKEPRDGLEKIASAKIVETATALRGLDQINCQKWGALNSGFLQQRVASI
jgi:hypothetical protein